MTVTKHGLKQATPGGWRPGDRAFKWLTLAMALTVFVLLVLIGFELWKGSELSLHRFGWRFLVTSDWDPVHEKFGALPAIYGTLVTSAIALIIAVPISIATAVFLTELAPQWMRQPLITFVELLAAIPSIILGFWGFFVMVPFLRDHLDHWLHKWFGFLPLFQGTILGIGSPTVSSPPETSSLSQVTILGIGYLAGGIILAIMAVPIITSISREILRSVPSLQREAAYALGATRWEVTRIAVLSYAKKGLFGAVILGLGRALGETMAVLMVMGNSMHISPSLFAPGVTLASGIASQFNGALELLHQSAVFELGLVLLGVTVVVNVLAQLLLKTFAGPAIKPQH